MLTGQKSEVRLEVDPPLGIIIYLEEGSYSGSFSPEMGNSNSRELLTRGVKLVVVPGSKAISRMANMHDTFSEAAHLTRPESCLRQQPPSRK